MQIIARLSPRWQSRFLGVGEATKGVGEALASQFVIARSVATWQSRFLGVGEATKGVEEALASLL